MREISGVVITRNEEDRIALCLNAMGKVCTEVIVVDTDSEDQTTQIARTMGARVHAAQWLGFGQTKNLGADIATYNWILSIDADEVLSDELVQTLNKLELREDQVYALDRISNLCGKWIHHSGWYPDWIPRLYHRKKVSWDHAHVHEQLVIPHGCQVEKLNGKLFHYSYQTFEQFDEKMERYARLSARSMLEKGRPYNP
ncbi:MAG: glycosyltransferase family 2 protein, partial [Saprospiraceae bacterium]|nr:glycosyltransferase family 2 protein [Saprospiraceae bacterium]